MQIRFTTALGALALSATCTAALAYDDVVVSGHSPPAHISLDQRATTACLDSFIARLLPGSKVPVRTVMPPDGESIFHYSTDIAVDPYRLMTVEMIATTARGAQLLAKSVCSVNRKARVVNITTRITDPERLAGLAVQDLRLAMTAH